MLVANDRFYVIDAEFAGKGTRAYDLATFLFETSVGKGPYLSPARAHAIRSECVDLVGQGGLLLCTTARMLDLLGFGSEHWPDKIPDVALRCDRYLDGLGVPRARTPSREGT